MIQPHVLEASLIKSKIKKLISTKNMKKTARGVHESSEESEKVYSGKD